MKQFDTDFNDDHWQMAKNSDLTPNKQISEIFAGLGLEPQDKLIPQAFVGATSIEMERRGWVSPRGNEQLVHAVNKQLLIKLCAEKKLLPSSVINEVVQEKSADIEEQQGFAPGRKQIKEIKEQVIDELLPRAFSVKRYSYAWINPVDGWLVIDASSPIKAEEVLTLLIRAINPFPASALQTVHSPVTAMTSWIATGESPVGFTIDQDTELRATGEGKAKVRYASHTLDTDDVRAHIATGKLCTQLAMTWNDRISFMLTEGLTIKRVTPLDVLKESDNGGGQDADERFDSDFMLMTGEVTKLLSDLIGALGGEVLPGNVSLMAA